MWEILGGHEDFKNEKSLIERFLVKEKRHIVSVVPVLSTGSKIITVPALFIPSVFSP